MGKLLLLVCVPVVSLFIFLSFTTPVYAACSVSFPSSIAPSSTVEIQVNGASGNPYTALIVDENNNPAMSAASSQINVGQFTTTIALTSPPNPGTYTIGVWDSSMGSDPQANACTGGGTIEVSTNASTVSDPNKPAEIGNVVKIIRNVISLLVPFAAIAFFIMFLVGGFQFLFSGGDPKAAGAARGTLTFAVIGIILVVASWLILLLVKFITGVDVTTVAIPGLSQ